MITTATTAVPFSPPDIGADEIAEVIATLESGWLSTGPRVRRFEAAFAAYVGAPHAVALNSCTAGLHLALLAAGVGPGDQVVTSPLTFCATANVILHTGATPVFADVDPETGNLDPDAAAAAVTPWTRALMPVHYAGRPADVPGLTAVARAHRLVTVEDAAHCLEGVAGGRKIGTTADFTAFSFYATKNLTTGEGGMLTTASAEAAERVRVASNHGISRNAWTRDQAAGAPRYDVVAAGFKYNMTDLQAAIGLHQLAAVDRHAERRRAICARYDEAFDGLPFAPWAPLPDGAVHARHLYVVRVREGVPGHAGLPRETLAAALAARGIATSVHFPALHLTRFYADRFGFTRGRFPHAERLADEVLSLPLSPALTDAHVDQVIDAVRDLYGA
ncbi:MAG: DegT/DnrJ/EryC1/StrS aminotransferase family protein [Vicinamibacterales bacterium]